MLGQKGQKHKLAGNNLSIPRIKIDPIVMISFALLIAICMYPELSLASSLEGQLDTTNNLVNGKLKMTALTAAAVLGGGYGVFKGNLGLIGKVIACIGGLALVLEWIKGGMAIMA